MYFSLVMFTLLRCRTGLSLVIFIFAPSVLFGCWAAAGSCGVDFERRTYVFVRYLSITYGTYLFDFCSIVSVLLRAWGYGFRAAGRRVGYVRRLGARLVSGLGFGFGAFVKFCVSLGGVSRAASQGSLFFYIEPAWVLRSIYSLGRVSKIRSGYCKVP